MGAVFEIPNRILVAIGGNATHPEDIEGTSREQKTIAASTAEALLPLALLDNELVITHCLLYTSPSPRDATLSRMPSSA